MAIFFLAGSMMMIGVFLNSQLAYMLPEASMYNIPENQIGQKTSWLTIYSLPFSLITTPFISFSFELLGRKATLTMSYLLTAALFFFIPYSSPSFAYLAMLRCMIGVSMAAPLAHPLINDYVRKGSRGKAIALNGLGQVFGDVFAMAVLLNISKYMTYHQSFMMAAIIIFMFGIFLYIFVENPNIDKFADRVRIRALKSHLRK